MTRAEWQTMHQVSDEKMVDIERCLKIFSRGKLRPKITRFWDIRELGKWGDGKKVERRG